jgi:hypothetical protein
MTTKLHEILAVEADQEGTFKRIFDEAVHTFKTKADHFIGTIKKLQMFESSREKENTSENKEMVTTVNDKINYVVDHAIRFFDVVFQ